MVLVSLGVQPNAWQFPAAALRDNASLRSFMHSFFFLPLGPAYQANTLACTVILLIAVILCQLVIIKRLMDKSLWVIRIQRTPSGRLLIPSSTVSFMCIEAVFAIAWISYIWIGRPDRAVQDIRTRHYWHSLMYIPLWSGAWASGYGTLYLSPGVTAISAKRMGRWDMRRLTSNAMMRNVLLLGFPVFVALVMSLMTIRVGGTYYHAASAWLTFDADIADLVPSEPPTSQTQDAAMHVWRSFSHAFYWLGVSYIAWSCWALLLLVSYLAVGGYLLLAIRRQIQEQQRIADIAAGNKIGGDMKRPSNGLFGQGISTWNDEMTRAFADEEARAVQSTFFPPINTPKARHDAGSSAKTKVSALSSAFTLVLTLFCCISLALAGYTMIAIHMSAVYAESQLSSAGLGRLWTAMHIVAQWLANIFGGLSFIAITNKAYEGFVDNAIPTKVRGLSQASGAFWKRARTAPRSTSDDLSDKSKSMTQAEIGMSPLSFKSRARFARIVRQPGSAGVDAPGDAPVGDGGQVKVTPTSDEGHGTPLLSPSKSSNTAKRSQTLSNFLMLETMRENEEENEMSTSGHEQISGALTEA